MKVEMLLMLLMPVKLKGIFASVKYGGGSIMLRRCCLAVDLTWTICLRLQFLSHVMKSELQTALL